jgi:hypothetical protein
MDDRGPGAAGVADATQSTMLAAADRNLYAAKHAGRDRVVADPPAAQNGHGRGHGDAAVPTQDRRYGSRR